MSAVPATRTYVEARPRLRVVQGQSRPIASAIAVRALAFAFIASATFLSSSLCGHVMVEKARREGIGGLMDLWIDERGVERRGQREGLVVQGRRI